MGTAPTIGPFHARPLRPLYAGPATIINGQPEPEIVTRGTRAQVSLNAAIVAGGGYPAPIRRTASFATFFKRLPPVNLVTGVKTHPGNAKKKR